MNEVQRHIYYQAHMLDECFVNESEEKLQIVSLKHLEMLFTLNQNPEDRLDIIQKAGKEFNQSNGKYAWFIVAEDGHCIAFDEDCNEVKISKITEDMLPIGIKKIIIPDFVKNIQNWAFENCKFLKSITIPDSVTSIGYGAFGACKSLKSIMIPNSVINIGEYAFQYCESLKSITIPNSVIRIGNHAFKWCKSLETITIPNSVKSIGWHTFEYCKSLKEVIFKGKTLEEVKNMNDYPWRIKDRSIIKCEA